MDVLKEFDKVKRKIYQNIIVLEQTEVPFNLFKQYNKYDKVYADNDDTTECIVLDVKETEICFICKSSGKQFLNSHKHPKSKKIFFVLEGELLINGEVVKKNTEYTLKKDTYHSVEYRKNTEVFIKITKDED